MNSGETVTILVYSSNTQQEQIEVFHCVHGATHRIHDLIQEWGDASGWIYGGDDGMGVAVNYTLGAIISMYTKPVQPDVGIR